MKETNFKHTDIGDIPHDWVLDTFDKVFTFIPNNTLPRDMLGKDGGVYDIHYGDILIKYGSILDAEKDDIPSIKKESCYKASHYVKNGDVIIADTAEDETVGKVCEVQNVCNKHIVSGLHTMWARPNDCVFAPKYLGYFMNGSIYHNQLLPFIQGIKVSSISKTAIKDTYIVIPPLAEQERIATALSDIDNLIAHLDLIIDKKKNIKQGAMQQLLTGKTRLHGFNDKWVTKKIKDIGELSGAGVDKLSLPDETPIRLVNYLDVFHRDHIYNDELNMWVTANERKLHNCNVVQGDVFFTPSSEMPYDIALSAVTMETMENVCYSYHIYRLRFKEKIDLNYKAYMFKSQSFYNQANTICEGSGKRYVISLAKFREMTVSYPPSLAEQQAIASTLTAMDNEIQALQTQREKYTLIKQGMMQQLLTGKIRI